MRAMHTTFLVGEIADRFMDQALYTSNILLLIKNRQRALFLSTFEGNMNLLQYHNIV